MWDKSRIGFYEFHESLHLDPHCVPQSPQELYPGTLGALNFRTALTEILVEIAVKAE
jgi:hypothetical protein